MAAKSRLFFTQNFAANLDSIQLFLGPDGRLAFRRLLARIFEDICPKLARFPLSGRSFLAHRIGSQEAQIRSFWIDSGVSFARETICESLRSTTMSRSTWCGVNDFTFWPSNITVNFPLTCNVSGRSAITEGQPKTTKVDVRTSSPMVISRRWKKKLPAKIVGRVVLRC